MVNVILVVGAVASALLAITTLIFKFYNPINKWIKESAEERESYKQTAKCLIRNQILSTYYKNRDKCEIKQYQYENTALLYEQYKKLKGNSFVDRTWEEIKRWKIIKD